MALTNSQQGVAAAGPTIAMLPPRMIPNRKQLDDRFPVLAFTILYDQPAYFEVILTTRKELFDPANAGRRTPSTFYSSRQDSKLIPIQGGTAVYFAPTAVLRGFATAMPRPAEIFFTVVAYADAQASNGVFSQRPDTLSASAPSVALSPHFGSDGFGDLLGMNPEKLRRFQPDVVKTMSLGVTQISAEEDRAEGEDGTTAPAFQVAPPPAVAAPVPPARVNQKETRAVAQEVAADEGYDDGYTGDTPPSSNLNFAAAQQTSFRSQDPEPGALANGDDEDRYPDNDHRAFGRRNSEPQQADKHFAGAAALSDNDDDDDRFSSDSHCASAGSGQNNGKGAVSYSADYGDEADDFHESGPEKHRGGTSEPAYQSLSSPAPAPATQAVPLTIEAKRDLLGKLGEYSAIDADGAYNGVLGPEHPAYRHYHIGLSFGIGPFNQERGDLGRLLEAMKQRDGAKFAEVFGHDADALLHTANADGPPAAGSAEGRSARLQKVGGADLWEEPWLGRFREAAAHKPFQSAQNQMAAVLFLDPMLPFARWMGLNTERALALLVDRAADLGVAPAQEWIANSAGPLQSAPQRHQTLAALGFESIRAFQNAHPGTETNGQWGPLTHAAAVAELRKKGTSPLPLPTTEQMLDALVRRASHTPGFHRVRALRNDGRLADAPFQLGQEKE